MKILNPFGEDFLIAHFQGGCHLGLHPVVKHYSETSIALPDDISIITACNNPGLAMLIQQLERNAIPCENDAEVGSWWVNTKKIQHVCTALARIKTPYVLILDADDVLFANDPHDILDRFYRYERQLLFGATVHDHPKQLIDKISDRDFRGRFRYLNAGTAFGETKAAKTFYSLVRDKHESGEIDNPDQSEQLIVRHAFAECTDWVDFDYRCSIFQTFGGTTLTEVDHETETFRVT